MTHASSAGGRSPGPALEDAIKRVGPHDHLCLVYESRSEQLASIVSYVREGIAQGEQCLYIVDENTASNVADAMRDGGVDVDAAVAAGDLMMPSSRDTYLQGGRFEPDGMIRFLKSATEEAVDAGYKGLRILGEMTWALGSKVEADEVLEYETKLNELFRSTKASAICQYNRERFSADIVEGVIETHPYVIYKGTLCENFYYVPPEEFLAPGGKARRVQRLLDNIRSRAVAEGRIRELNRELQERVAKRTADLEQANRELEAFTYSVSHDLRAPLRGIETLSRVLEEDHGSRLDGDGQAILTRLQDESDRMRRLVNDLLDLSRAGREDIRREHVDLSGLARDVVARLREVQPGRDVRVHVAEGLTAYADPRLTRVVLDNLIGNAWKYTSTTPRARITVEAEERDGSRVFAVADNGVGFDAANADRVFAPFERLHASTDFKGTGVGLATVKRIVERHGGHVWAEGVPDRGATFRFTL